MHNLEIALRETVQEYTRNQLMVDISVLHTLNPGIMFNSGFYMNMDDFEAMCKDYMKKTKPEQFL